MKFEIERTLDTAMNNTVRVTVQACIKLVRLSTTTIEAEQQLEKLLAECPSSCIERD